MFEGKGIKRLRIQFIHIQFEIPGRYPKGVVRKGVA